MVRSADDMEKAASERKEIGMDLLEVVSALSRTKVEKHYEFDVFLRDGDDVNRTSFTRSRGVEAIGPVWSFLDRAPFGRQETWVDSPAGYAQGEPYSWWRRHDEYEEAR